MPADPRVLQALDDRLVSRVRAAANNAPGAPDSAREIFAADAHLLCTFPELDPFGSREGVEYLGPPGRPERGLEVAWNEPDRDHVLAYLKPGAPRVDAVLAALGTLDAEVIVALPGIEPASAHALSNANVRIFAQPVDVPPLMAGASLAVFHAGPGFAAHAIMAGVPMALLPLQLEQFLVAQRVVQAGIGELASPEHAAPDFGEWFSRVMSSASLREAARRSATKHRGHSFAAAARAAAGRIASLAAA
jgi:UDP:flavonoid glycosyltransferase YjiC (YdhE family)